MAGVRSTRLSGAAAATHGLGSQLKWKTQKLKGPIVPSRMTIARSPDDAHSVNFTRKVDKASGGQTFSLFVDPEGPNYATVHIATDKAGNPVQLRIGGREPNSPEERLFAVNLYRGASLFDESQSSRQRRPGPNEVGIFTESTSGGQPTRKFKASIEPKLRTAFSIAKQLAKSGGGYSAGRLYDTAQTMRDLIPSSVKSISMSKAW